MAVNLKGPMLASRAAARHMAAHGGGVIQHNALIAASAADGAFSHYSASKASLLALMRSMAVELCKPQHLCQCDEPWLYPHRTAA